MPEYRRDFQPGGTYFFTLVTQNCAPLFENPDARARLRQAMRAQQLRRPFDIEAIVLLPDHIHMILTLPPGDENFPTRLAAIKADFTRMHLRGGGLEQPTSATRQRQEHRGVWQRRFWEHRIRDERDLYAHYDYIHYNPVKHALASCPHAWPYSSFHRHVRLNHYDRDWLCACADRLPKAPDFRHLPSNE